MHNSELKRLERDFGWDIAEQADLESGVWVSREHREPKPGSEIHFPSTGHDATVQVEEQSFWFQHRNTVIWEKLMSTAVPEGIWDVGSGTGFVSAHFAENGLSVVAVEPGFSGAKIASERGLLSSICGFFEKLNLPDESLPAIGSFDVIEHLENPRLLIAECFRTLAPGGLLILTVPGMQQLWSRTDEVSGHFRRYSPNQLNALLEAEGFHTIQSSYFMSILVPPLFVLRKWHDRRDKRLSNEQLLAKETQRLSPQRFSIGVAFLSLLLRVELAISRHMNFPFGSSVCGVYRKPSSSGSSE